MVLRRHRCSSDKRWGQTAWTKGYRRSALNSSAMKACDVIVQNHMYDVMTGHTLAYGTSARFKAVLG